MVNPRGGELSYSSTRRRSRWCHVENVTGRPFAFHQYFIFNPIVSGPRANKHSATRRKSARFFGQFRSSAKPTAAWYSLILPLIPAMIDRRSPSMPKLSTRRQRSANCSSSQRIAPPSPVPKTFVAWKLTATGISAVTRSCLDAIASNPAAASITTGTPVSFKNRPQLRGVDQLSVRRDHQDGPGPLQCGVRN